MALDTKQRQKAQCVCVCTDEHGSSRYCRRLVPGWWRIRLDDGAKHRGSDRHPRGERAAPHRARPSAAGGSGEARAARRGQEQLKTSFDALRPRHASISTDEFLKLADQKLGNVQKDALGEIGKRQQAFDELISPIRDVADAGRPEARRCSEHNRAPDAARDLRRCSRHPPAAGRLRERDGQPGPRAAHAHRARPLGRDAAAARRRARRHAGLLRLRRAAVAHRRIRAPAARPRRQAARRPHHRHRREGAARGVSRRAGRAPTSTSARGGWPITRARCATT